MKGFACPMKRIIITIGLVLLTGAAAAPGLAETLRWTYDGVYGPQNWGLISEDYAACGEGEQQSPVAIDRIQITDLPPLDIHWRATDWTIYNAGHAMRAEASDGGYILIDGTRYQLMQFHFHTSSEHSIEGEVFPMEAHFVHVSQDDQIAVVAVMLVGGGRNAALEKVLARVSHLENDPKSLSRFDPSSFVDPNAHYIRYQGSLTTPPCSETVIWTVLTDPVVVSDAAITAHSILFGNNARPIQPKNRRYILGAAR